MTIRALITVRCIDRHQLDISISSRRELPPVIQELVTDFASDIAEQIPLTRRLVDGQCFQAHIRLKPFFERYETSDGTDYDAGVLVSNIRIFKRKLP